MEPLETTLIPWAQEVAGSNPVARPVASAIWPRLADPKNFHVTKSAPAFPAVFSCCVKTNAEVHRPMVRERGRVRLRRGLSSCNVVHSPERDFHRKTSAQKAAESSPYQRAFFIQVTRARSMRERGRSRFLLREPIGLRPLGLAARLRSE